MKRFIIILMVWHGLAIAQEEAGLPLKELRTFAEVFIRVQQGFVEPISDQQLLQYAIEGMLSNLDPHSAYLDEPHFQELQEGTSGTFGGLGIEVTKKDDFIYVIAPIDDTPAQKAGVQAGDYIIRLNGQSLKGMSLNEAVQLMRGQPGTQIKLTIRRQGVPEPIEIEITRAIIKHQSIKSKLLEPGIGYIRIVQFQTPTAKDLKKALQKLVKQNGAPLKGLILDLRNNPGGILQAAVAVADAFLEQGLIVYTQGKLEHSRLEFKAKPGDLLQGKPMVVLVNEGSASASEIVAGALQDHQRAVIMGRTTFGKGSVQTVIPIDNKTAIKLTTARYYTPKGRSIQAKGIEPDILIEKVELKPVADHAIKEADLRDHLDNPQAQPDQKTKKQDKLLQKDYELGEALKIIKGIILVKG